MKIFQFKINLRVSQNLDSMMQSRTSKTIVAERKCPTEAEYTFTISLKVAKVNSQSSDEKPVSYEEMSIRPC